jgi:hypothetical protein
MALGLGIVVLDDDVFQTVDKFVTHNAHSMSVTYTPAGEFPGGTAWIVLVLVCY